MPSQELASQISDALASYVLPKHAHTATDKRNKEWIKYCAPRPEDCGTGQPFVPSEVLNIAIFQEPNMFYESAVLDIQSHEHAQRVIKTYEKFPNYLVFTFIEIGLAAQLDEEAGNTEKTDALLAYEDDLKSICDQMKDYGFKYIGRIDMRVGVGQDIINVINAFLHPTD